MRTSQVGEVAWFLLRVVAGALFLLHGGQKLFGWFGGMGGVPGATVPLMSQMGLAGVIEFFGGLCLTLGLMTRPFAFFMAGEMAVAYFQAHAPHGPIPLQNHGEPAVLYCFIFLFFLGNGAGPLSLDAALFHRHRHSTHHDHDAHLPLPGHAPA